MELKTSFVYQLFPKNGTESQNHYYICQYRVLSTGKRITVRGYDLPRMKSVQYCMQLKEVHTASHGVQYDMETYENYVEPSEDAILAYLSSGVIKGIGLKTAQKIYDRFGKKTIDVLENEIDLLLNVPGITLKKLCTIKQSYEQNKGDKELSCFLLKYHFTVSQIRRITKVIHSNALEVIKENPYCLINVPGISFDMIEPMADECHIQPCDYRRIKGAAVQVLRNAMVSGNTCMQLPIFCSALIYILHTTMVHENNIFDIVRRLLEDRIIFYRKTMEKSMVQYVFLPETVQAEHDIAKYIVDFMKRPVEKFPDVEKAIRNTSIEVVLDESQMQAVRKAVEEPFSIITGGPGTGKTTIIKVICDLFEKKGKYNILLASPTGRAARRMAEVTGREAVTIHHALGIGMQNGEDQSLENFETEIQELKYDLIIVDEYSMTDLFLTEKLFRNIVSGQIVIVGDDEQLESVGPGAVLKEMISSGVVPVTRLLYKHRQKEGSLISENADRMRQGITDLVEGSDFNCIEENDISIVEEKMVQSYLEAVQEFGLDQVTCLCPFKDYEAGTKRMNQILQQKLNPTGERWNATERNFRIGDPVMQLRNKDEVSNGDVGYITAFFVKEGKEMLEVTFFGVHKEYYSTDDLDDLCLAYAMTIHKSQGSEYSCVITCLTSFHYLKLRGNLKRNLPYTAFTRGKKRVMFYGEKAVLAKAICNTSKRITLLSQEIRKQTEKRKEKAEYTQLKLAL